MRIALVHDALVNRGGAERVFELLCQTFPAADLYTSVYISSRASPFFAERSMRTTFLQRLVRSEGQLKWMFPVANLAMAGLPMDGYDVVLSSSTFCAKHVVVPNGVHVCYCYTPFRLLWQPEAYGLVGPSAALAAPLLKVFRTWDRAAARRVDLFVVMTEEMRGRIRESYRKEAVVVPPAIDCSSYAASDGSDDYFLVVSRLEHYKRVDVAIQAFSRRGDRLRVVGAGSKERWLKAQARSNVEFLGVVNDAELRELYARCRAVIYPQREDYGLVPLESNASGRPVVCFGLGGVQTTMVPFDGTNQATATAVFFEEQSVDALLGALDRFETVEFRREALVANAQRFDRPLFQDRIRRIVGAAAGGGAVE